MYVRPPLERIIHYMCLMLDELEGVDDLFEPLTAADVKMADLDEMIDKTEQILVWCKKTKKEKENYADS